MTLPHDRVANQDFGMQMKAISINDLSTKLLSFTIAKKALARVFGILQYTSHQESTGQPKGPAAQDIAGPVYAKGYAR
jgi:hypothetical protein